jgi:hypothetical protein
MFSGALFGTATNESRQHPAHLSARLLFNAGSRNRRSLRHGSSALISPCVRGSSSLCWRHDPICRRPHRDPKTDSYRRQRLSDRVARTEPKTGYGGCQGKGRSRCSRCSVSQECLQGWLLVELKLLAPVRVDLSVLAPTRSNGWRSSHTNNYLEVG